tara:strand:+ start:952 stop:1383 length:432 start_codon:yes stop_codon:yes gene_type:complete
MEENKNLNILLNSSIGEKTTYTEETLDKSFAKLDCEDTIEIDYNPNNEKDTILKDNGWSEFKQKDLEEFVDMFSNYADENSSNKIDWEKFDYTIHNEAYYAEKFPGFDSSVHKILADCSRKKIEEHRGGVVKKTKGDFIVTFD